MGGRRVRSGYSVVPIGRREVTDPEVQRMRDERDRLETDIVATVRSAGVATAPEVARAFKMPSSTAASIMQKIQGDGRLVSSIEARDGYRFRWYRCP